MQETWVQSLIWEDPTCCGATKTIMKVTQLLSGSLWPCGLQHIRLPCPSLSSRVCWNSSPLSWWCYLSISSSATLFSFCLQSFPASGSFPGSWLFALGGQRTGASASVSVLPMHIQGWFPLELTGFISLLSEGLSRIFSITIWRHMSFQILNFRIEWTFPPCLTAILDLGRLLMKGAQKGSWPL